MANPNITSKVITTVDGTFTDNGAVGGANKKVQLSIGYLDVKDLLYSKKGWFSALQEPLNSEHLLDRGTAIIYKTNRVITDDYAYGASTVQPGGLDSVSVNLDYIKTVKLALESADLARLGAKAVEGGYEIGKALINKEQMAAAIAQQVYLGAKTTDGLLKSAGTVVNVEIPVEKKGDQLPSFEVARQTIWNTFWDIKAQYQTLINDNIIGVDPEDVFIMASPIAMKYLIQAVSFVGSDISSTRFTNGDIVEIAGLKVAQNNWLGKNIAKGLIDKVEAFDLSGADFIICVKGCYFFPWSNANPITTIVEPLNKNLYTMAKYSVNKVGGVAVYPELIKAFRIVLVEPTTT